MTDEPLTFDVLIIGGGPAGMSAALWSSDLGLSCCLIDAGDVLGGQLHNVYSPIQNYLGTDFKNGADCARKFSQSLERLSLPAYASTSVTAIDPSRMTISTEQGMSLRGKALVIATGVRRRILGVPGESDLRGRGILDSGAKDPQKAAGQTVAVIGGGDAALENALILSAHAEHIYIIHRRAEFSAREEFVSAVTSKKNIEPIFSSTVSRFQGDEELNAIEVLDSFGTMQTLKVSRAIVRIGFEPNSELARGILALDYDGYIVADAFGRTSLPLIFAVGDVAFKLSPTIATAVGSAATAVKTIYSLIRNSE